MAHVEGNFDPQLFHVSGDDRRAGIGPPADNGIGFDPEKSSNEASNRFIYMKERAILLGGEVKVTSSLNKGTTVQIEIPYSN